MFDSIRRHQKWLWAVITTLTIISFVAFFSPRSQSGSSRTGGLLGVDQVGKIAGRGISRDEYIDAYREAELRYLFSTGDWPRNDEMTRQLGIMERETRNRLLLVEKLREMKVEVTEKAVAEWIAEAFRDRQRQVFQKEAYDQFVKTRLAEHGLTAGDFERFVRHEVGVQHLISLAGLTGNLVNPQEAEMLYRRENEQADTEAIFLSTSNFLSKVTIDPAGLATYYTNHQAEYRVPERARVLYVKFEMTNFLAEAEQKMAQNTNLNQYVDAVYAQRGTNAFLDPNNQPMTPDAAKAKIKDESRRQFALVEARKKAIDFANKLMEMPPGTNNLANLAAAEGHLTRVTEPFEEFGGPVGLNVPETFAKAAFQLNPQTPFYEQPIVGEDGVYIIGLNQRIPSELPSLDSVRERVSESYRRSRAGEMVQAAGDALSKAVTDGLAQGQTLQAAAGTNAVWIDLPPFSQKTTALPEIQGRGDLATLKNAAFALGAGKASAFAPTRDGGFIVRLQAKVPATDAKVKSELAEFTADLRRTRQYEAFSDWLRKETELAHITLPGDKKSETK